MKGSCAAGRLAAAALIFASAASAQIADKAPDTASEARDRGFPWIAHSSADAFYLQSPSGEHTPYQVSFYQGITIQSLRFAWFHAGLRTRETMVSGFDRPYREPMILKLMGTAEVLRDYAYVFLAGNVPIIANHIDSTDTAFLANSLSEYNVFPYPNFLSPQAIHVGAFGRYRFSTWDVMAGVSYARAGRVEPVEDNAFFPAAYFDLFARALYEGRLARHRFDGKATLYQDESSKQRIPAHREGSLFQVRYGYLHFARGRSWQLGAGASWKLADANRMLRIERPLEAVAANDNVQRAYGEMAMSFAPRPNWLMRVHLLPRALIKTGTGSEIGHETELGLSWALRLFGVHRFRAAGTGLYGNFLGEDYLGFGCRFEFSFRHLGFQDLEAQAEGMEGGG